MKHGVTYCTQATIPNEMQMKNLKLVSLTSKYDKNRLGTRRITKIRRIRRITEKVDYSFLYTNTEVEKVTRTISGRDFIYTQNMKYIAHVCIGANTSMTMIMLFAKPARRYFQDL